LKAEESASTLVGQNSTQKPQALQRSTTIETRPFANGISELKVVEPPRNLSHYACWGGAVGCDTDH
jgi:hypothetical protein